MTDVEVSPRLTRRIAQHFELGTADNVLAALRALQPIAVGRQDVERIQASLVIRVQGDWSAFQKRLALVNQDWRDALVGAELGNDD